MPDEKKGILSQITPGNLITIGVFLVGGIVTWARMQAHLEDDTLHINKGEVILTDQEYKDLLRHANTVNNEFHKIQENRDRVIELEKGDAVHFSEYQTLFQEHDDLESKVSRIYKELKDEINNID